MTQAGAVSLRAGSTPGWGTAASVSFRATRKPFTVLHPFALLGKLLRTAVTKRRNWRAHSQSGPPGVGHEIGNTRYHANQRPPAPHADPPPPGHYPPGSPATAARCNGRPAASADTLTMTFILKPPFWLATASATLQEPRRGSRGSLAVDQEEVADGYGEGGTQRQNRQ